MLEELLPDSAVLEELLSGSFSLAELLSGSSVLEELLSVSCSFSGLELSDSDSSSMVSDWDTLLDPSDGSSSEEEQAVKVETIIRAAMRIDRILLFI